MGLFTERPTFSGAQNFKLQSRLGKSFECAFHELSDFAGILLGTRRVENLANALRE